MLPFKSKKTLRSNSGKSLLEDRPSLTSLTPEKPAELSTRPRNCKVARSIKQVRQAAEARSKSAVRRQIDLLQNQTPSTTTTTTSKPNSVDKSKKLPEKFEILSKFFDSLYSAMLLLRSKGLAPNFSNLCPRIEDLTDRRFSYGHLAQLKFILPEAIELKKVLVFEERSCCMKPDLHISFNFGVLDDQDGLQSENKYMQLRKYMQLSKLFRARLSEFVSSHPEIDDVPKDLLPRPFNCPSQDLVSKTNSLSSVKTSIEQLATSSTNVADEMPFSHHSEESQGFRIIKSRVPMTVNGSSKQKEFIGASNLSQSFSRRFSQKVVNREMENTDQATNPCDESSSHFDTRPNIETESCNTVSSSNLSSPVKIHSNSTYASPLRSTPAKLVSTPARLMASTPAMAPPKRSSMSPDDDSYCSTNKLVRRPPRSRSLIFDTPTKEDKKEHDIDVERSASLSDDILDVLPQSLLQSIREKERKAKEEQMPAISQAKRRQKMIDNLPKLFNSIFFLFHKRTVITKEELIYKIVVGNADIVDKREIEEQIVLLLELVPEWISEKLASSGDVLLCIDKLSSAETVRARLEEAK